MKRKWHLVRPRPRRNIRGRLVPPIDRLRTCVTPGPHLAVRTPSWTGSGPGVTGDCLGFAGTTPAFHVAVGDQRPVVLADSHLTRRPMATQLRTTSSPVYR